jgi:tetratricopeptide (TPR) repeat protein
MFQKQALEQYHIFNDSISLSGCYAGLAINYIELDSFDLAISNLDLANELNIQFNNLHEQGGIYVNYATAYRNKGDFKNALKYARLAHQATLGKNGNFDSYKNALLELSLAYSKMGNMPKAFMYHVEYSAVKDSMMSRQNIRAATSLEMNYDFKKRRFEDSLIHQNQIQL